MIDFPLTVTAVVFLYLVLSAILDYRKRTTYVWPWVVICSVGMAMFISTVVSGNVPVSVLSYLLAIMFIPLIVPVVLMRFQRFQLGDILAFVGIGLTVPISPVLLVSVFPFNLMSVAVYLNSLFLWTVYSVVNKKVKTGGLPFLMFLTGGFCLALIGL